MKEKIHIPPENIRLAFFDLDETITSRETDNLWAVWRSKRSPRGLMDLLRLQRINKLYYSHNLRPEDYRDYHLSRASSMTPVSYKNLAGDFVHFVMDHYIYNQMLELLEYNRNTGIKNVLITAQDEIIASVFQEKLNMDDCLASRYIIENNKFTDMEVPLCFKEGKVYWAGQYLREHSISWDQCAFYSDSMNDLPLLNVCACPVAVNPGKEFEELCRNRSWTVINPK